MLNWGNLSQFSSVAQSCPTLIHIYEWITAFQASLSINSQNLLKLMSIELVMPSSHLILCCSLLLLPPLPPSIRAFSNESTLHMRWPKYWSFSFSISPSNLRFQYNAPFHLVYFPFHLYFCLSYIQKLYSSKIINSLISCNKMQTLYLLYGAVIVSVCGLSVSSTWRHLVYLQGTVDCCLVTRFFSWVIISF